MSDSILNPVELTVGMCVGLLPAAARHLRALFKISPELNQSDRYEIIEVVEGKKRDYETDLDDPTTGATKLKNLRSGVVLDINDIFLDEKDDYWAFLTSHQPELFVKVIKENL